MNLENIANYRVMVIGDAMLDTWVEGRVTRTSPEAPVPVLAHSTSHYMLGGAANVAVNLLNLGVACTLVSVVGRDAAALKITDELAKHDVLEAYLYTDAGMVTTCKTRFVGNDQHIMRWDHEQRLAMPEDMLQQILAVVQEQIALHDAIIVSDYNKGMITPQIQAVIAQCCEEQDKLLIVDSKQLPAVPWPAAAWTTPNLVELSAVLGQAADVGNLNAALDAWSTKTGSEYILVTGSEQGMWCCTQDRDVWIIQHASSMNHEPRDVSGAGDAVVAAWCLAMTAGHDYATAMSWASMCAAIVIGKPYTAAITPQDIRCWQNAAGLEDAQAMAEHARQQGLRVGLINGCFDCIHHGHWQFLQRARAACDVLLVAVNCDATVTARKGLTRPIQRQEHRLQAIAACRWVDLAWIFQDQDASNIIAAIRPHVVFKGQDYANVMLVEQDSIAAASAEVMIIATDAYSTSRFLDDVVAKLATNK